MKFMWKEFENDYAFNREATVEFPWRMSVLTICGGIPNIRYCWKIFTIEGEYDNDNNPFTNIDIAKEYAESALDTWICSFSGDQQEILREYENRVTRAMLSDYKFCDGRLHTDKDEYERLCELIGKEELDQLIKEVNGIIEK